MSTNPSPDPARPPGAEHLAALFDSCPLALVVEGGVGICYMNNAARAMFGNEEGAASALRHGNDNANPLASWPIALEGGMGRVFTFPTESEQKRAEQARIFEQVHDAIIQTDLAGTIRGWNFGAERLFGYTFTEAAGQNVAFLYFEEDRDRIGALVMEPLLAAGKHELTLRNRRKDGSECLIRLSLSLLRDATGAPSGMVGYSQDVTRYVKTRLALQASEAKYRSLFETSPVGIGVWRAGRLAEANESLLRMMGWTRDRLASGEIDSPLPIRGTEELIRANGTPFPVFVELVTDTTASAETAAYVLDLSQQKEAEEAARRSRQHLELAVEGAEIGVWEWSPATGYIDFNERLQRALGFAPDEAPTTPQGWTGLLHPDDAPRALERLNDHLEGKSSSFEAEFRLRGFQGDWKWMLARGRVTDRAADGSAVRCSGTCLDVTDSKEAELGLARSEQRFRAIFNQTFQFIGLLSREGILLEANQTALDFGGFGAEDAIGRPFPETGWWLISPEARHRLAEAIRQAAAGEFVRYEVEVWGAGRRPTPIDFSLRPIFNPSGGVDLIIAEGRDITDIRRAQHLASAEGERQRLEAVLRSMTNGVVIADESGVTLSRNPAAEALLGSCYELCSLEGRPLAATDWPLSRALRGDTVAGEDLMVRQADGTRSIVHVGAAPVHDAEGRLVLVVETLRDVTRQYEIERELRRSNEVRDLALQAGQMTFWRWEPNRSDLSLTDCMSGFTPSPSGGSNAIHPDDRERMLRFEVECREGRVHEAEYRVLAAGGDSLWKASRGQRIVAKTGSLLAITGVTWDITARKAAVAEIERINASLHQLSGRLLMLQDEERRRLARELHDGPVQTLSGVAMSLSVLAKSRNLAAFERERTMADDCLLWVKQCSEEMRSFSYLLHSPILDELGLTSALRGWITGFIDRSGMEVDMDLSEAGRLGAEAETALFRIAQEALGNAYRHSRSSSATVRLRLTAAEVLLEVEDRGQGIPLAVLEGRSERQPLGVGIRGMRERARQLGGELRIDSQPGRTLVRVDLPLQGTVGQ